MPTRIVLIVALLGFLGYSPRICAADSPDPARFGLIDSFFPRKKIDTSIMGVNAFCNDARFGSIRSQLQEVKNVLRLKHLRVLFAWDDNVQPSPGSRPNFSFYDNIARQIPRGTRALVVVTGVPSWMSDPANWVTGSPHTTFVRRWVRRVVNRYQRNARIAGFQIWNEPNDSANPHNHLMNFVDNPAQYADMLAHASKHIKSRKRRRAVVNAATTAINQSYPKSLNYNKALQSMGAEALVDAWAVHYYGSHYENVLRPNGVGDYLQSVSKPIWVTESGARGINEQLEYVERTWPFLKEQVPGINRFYLYQFTDGEDADSTYGLRNPTEGLSISDLYIYLRDRP